MATDPVCKMNVEPEKAAAKENFADQEYYFCSGVIPLVVSLISSLKGRFEALKGCSKQAVCHQYASLI